MEPIRLQKFFSDCGIMSRRAAEAEIEAGRVTVNDVKAYLGQKIDPDTDIVKHNGKTIEAKMVSAAKIPSFTYIMLNKPSGYVTTLSDEKGRPCITELLEGVSERVYPVGRLDMYSEGLLLLTNDGEMTNRLTHPKYHIPKVYNLRIKGKVSPEDVKKLAEPMSVDGYDLKPVNASLISVKDDSSLIRMTLFEGRNRQIRKMCDVVGLTIMKLKRVSVGEIELGTLSSGKWRYLTKGQIEYLRRETKLNTERKKNAGN